MGNRKMCPFIHMVGCPGDTQDTCPANTNSKCQIIAPKKKMVRVKAGAWFDNGFLHTTSDPSWKKDIAYITCTILIEAKWLKENT